MDLKTAIIPFPTSLTNLPLIQSHWVVCPLFYPKTFWLIKINFKNLGVHILRQLLNLNTRLLNLTYDISNFLNRSLPLSLKYISRGGILNISENYAEIYLIITLFLEITIRKLVNIRKAVQFLIKLRAGIAFNSDLIKYLSSFQRNQYYRSDVLGLLLRFISKKKECKLYQVKTSVINPTQCINT